MASSLKCELDYTLPDDAWKDSFDKLLDVKPVLRELNIIKRDVRASFNNDSSFENSKELSQFLTVPKASSRKTPTSISTPVGKLPRQPFKCSISPINQWKFQFLKPSKKRQKSVGSKKLQSTVMDPIVIEIDFDDANNKTKESSGHLAAKDTSLSVLLRRDRKSGKKATGLRQVLFHSKINENSPGDSEKQKNMFDEHKSTRKRSSHEKSKRKSSTNMTIQPGKWRKSLSCLRRSQISKAQTRRSSKRNVCRLEAIADEDYCEFVEYFSPSKFIGKRKTLLIKPETTAEEDVEYIVDPREFVLKYCNQAEPLLFNEVYSKKLMPHCHKIGEGVYGEVFVKKVEGESIVCKIIPIEGTEMINGEVQKTFEHILPEVVISHELANLRETIANNVTSGFVQAKKVSCVYGKYPSHLVQKWEEYDKEKISENDHPGDFSDEQMYIVLELEFAGNDLETFIFNNAEQSFFALKQIVFTLAVAELALEFEHRDLHWGNILIKATNDTELTYKLDGKTIKIPSMGIKVTIIDYTLSRIKYKNHCFYNDLTNDEELFAASGDYQFDIYRMMRTILGKNWERFEPKTNIYWISYIISKLTNGVKYKNTFSKGHGQYLRKMRFLKNEVLEFKSANEFSKRLEDI